MKLAMPVIIAKTRHFCSEDLALRFSKSYRSKACVILNTIGSDFVIVCDPGKEYSWANRH